MSDTKQFSMALTSGGAHAGATCWFVEGLERLPARGAGAPYIPPMPPPWP
jgi:hypothetical protein